VSVEVRAPAALACLMGSPAPPELAAGLATLLDLPAAVQETWGEVLEVNLAGVLDDRTETFMKRYCRRYELEPAVLAPAVKACRFLFLQAVKSGVDRAAFIADLGSLLPEDQAVRVRALLLPHFDSELPRLRQVAILSSVAEHGRVVRSVRWRMDVIKSSNHSVKLDVPVATITLQYQEGPNAGQASYQLLPEQAAELRRALDALLG
jgi:hypothetical protein